MARSFFSKLKTNGFVCLVVIWYSHIILSQINTVSNTFTTDIILSVKIIERFIKYTHLCIWTIQFLVDSKLILEDLFQRNKPYSIFGISRNISFLRITETCSLSENSYIQWCFIKSWQKPILYCEEIVLLNAKLYAWK